MFHQSAEKSSPCCAFRLVMSLVLGMLVLYAYSLSCSRFSSSYGGSAMY